jgi:hypothetical protein
MTIEQAKTLIQDIQNRTDIGPAQKAAMTLRVQAQFRRENPNEDFDELLG